MQIRKLILDSAEAFSLGDFYKNILQLPVTKNANGIDVSIGGSEVFFNQATTTSKPLYHIAINIPSNKIEEAKAWLKGKVELIWLEDYESDIAEFVTWKARSVYFFDIAGNLLELIARVDAGNATEESFSSRQFLSVSEIGIVFPKTEIEKKTESLMNHYALPFFSKQPPYPNFKAVGDDEGLFIIVPEGRNWYPTNDIPAGIFPLQVEFEWMGKKYKEDFGN